MGDLTRRRILQAAALTAAGAVASGCSGGGGTPSGGPAAGRLTWWDHQNQLEPAKRKIFEKFAAAEGGVPVDYTYNNPAKLGQTLQLAKQSNQLPDVHSNAGLTVPVPQLISGGWVSPLELNDAAMKRLDGKLVEGIHVFDGKPYSFPIFDYHVYSNVTWFNTKLVTQAGLDPEAPPRTYDEFRSAARAVKESSGGKAQGWIWNIGMPDRMGDQVNMLAQAAGFEGGGGTLYRTGEYAYHSEPYLAVIEFLLSLKQDQLLVPGAQTMIDDAARTRWVAGIAGYYFDGPWCPGVALKNTPAFADSLGVGPILTPNPGEPATYRGTQGGEYWLTPGTKMAEQANQLLSDYFTTEEYSVEIANTMSQPPRDLAAVQKSTAHPAYKKLIGWFADQVFLAPEAVVKNPQTSKVAAETKAIKPGLGDIVQGAFSGDVTDVRGALQELSDKSNAERERAIGAAKAKGAEVSADDYAFPDWQPKADYGKDKY